ncbi:MAG: alkaline phosphatase family protein [Candidatus Bipolaricaulota bacterium]|nr:alkaline phosphatase family protein [Candidatus Bipolaricaulota bacterium]
MTQAQHVLNTILNDTDGARPHYERYSLLAVPATIEACFGLPPSGPSLVEELGLRPAELVVSVVVDGLGYQALESLRAQGKVDLGPFRGGAYLPLTSVFPSTTTAALATLSTGATPIVHGVLGYKLFRPEVGSVVDMIRLATPGGRENGLEKLGLPPEGLLPCPTLYSRLGAAGVGTTLLLPKFLADSGLSRVLYQGVGRTVPYLSASDLLMHIGDAVQGPRPLFLSVYWPTTDSLGHLYGPRSPAFELEVAHVFEVLQRMAELLPPGATLLVTADHGFYEADPVRDMVNCAVQPALRDGLLLPPVGDPRAAYLFLRRGGEAEVLAFFARFFPEEFAVLSVEEALGRRLWGLEDPRPEVRALLGDYLVLSRKRKFLLWPTEEFKLRGLHGSLTPEELYVPLLARRI